MRTLIIISLFLFSGFFFLNAQTGSRTDAYKIESDGYFSTLSVSAYGLIATDNYASKLYLIHNGKAEELSSSAGCGRYYNLSPDKSKIGFKLIEADGKQSPAILDIQTKKITKLHNPVDLCGQVCFSENGKTAFTIANSLFVLFNNTAQTYDLGCYSNIVALSPDGQKVIFNDDNDQLFLLNLLTNEKTLITDNTGGFAFPQWSPDGNKIAFHSISGKLYSLNLLTDKTVILAENTGTAAWDDDSEFIFFQQNYNENLSLTGTDIFKVKSDGTNIVNITNSPDVNEMSPAVKGHDLFFHTYDKREIHKVSFNTGKTALAGTTVLISHAAPLSINFFSSVPTRANVLVPGTVPYVNQVYDTPEWHYGYGSCAPTTAIMAIAYYNKVPKWPTTTSNGVGNHNSDYGSYVADRYRFNEYYYQDISATGGGENSYGGYGYMWTGSWSPHSRMRQYIENHYITSVQEDADNWTKAMAQINAGYPFPVCNLLTSAGHLTLGIGYISGQHTMIFNDPYGNKNNTSWPNWYGAGAKYDWPGYNNGFQNLNTVAWTVTAEGSEVAYNDTIIDDVYYNHGFYVNNSLNSSTQRYYHDQNAGYNGHFWFTGTVLTSDICYVTWTPNLPAAGNYEVLAYLPGGTNANAVGAKYKIHHNGGIANVVVDQNLYAGQWVSLGIYNFLQGQAGYVYLGDSTGIESQNLAWDAIHFKKITPTDIIAPVTSISSPGNWKTADFTATFTDVDNANGSGIEKAYYQVIDFDGTNWGANADHGFFADNFDILNSSVWATPANSGSWIAVNGNLFQSDSTNTNTNIYAALNQNLSNRYLYQFSMKLESAPEGTNQRRFGFHFFCDTGSTLNRSNSYFIFFRQETSRLEFYKVVQNSFTQMKVVDNVITNIGQLYDVKVIFDRITGLVAVYRDNQFVSSWTDTSPLTTPGNFISFRTGNVKASVSELKIFRSRYPGLNVSVGTAGSDIRYQNPNPTTIGAKIKSIVADSAGNLSVISYHDLNIDWTPPADISTVNDGLSNDVDTIFVTNELSASWTSSDDPNSGTTHYWYAIGISAGATDVIDWTENGTAINFTINNGFTLNYNQLYFVSVKAENAAGLVSGITSSNGVIVKQPFATPVANFTNSASTVCVGTPINFYNNSTNAISYFWDVAGPENFSSTATSPSFDFTISGTYSIQLIATGPAESDSISQNINITVNQLPVAYAGNDTAVCSGEGVILTATGGVSYQWSNGITNGISFTPQQTDTYAVTVTDENNCSNPDTVTVSVNPIPAAVAGENQTVCAGDSITLSASGGTLYTWDHAVSNNIPFVPAQTDIYTVTVTNSYNCSAVNSLMVTVANIPVASFNVNSTTGLAPFAALFENTSQNADFYSWNFGDGGVTTDANPYHIYTNGGQFTVTLIASSSICGSDTAYIAMQVDTITGIAENEMVNNFNIYPNPFKTSFTIFYDLPANENISIKLFDILGKSHRIISNKKFNSGLNMIQVDANELNLSDGIFIIEFKTGKKTFYNKIIQEK